MTDSHDILKLIIPAFASTFQFWPYSSYYEVHAEVPNYDENTLVKEK